MRELVEAFDSVEAFVRDHGADPASALVEDSTALCRYVVRTDKIEEALLDIDRLTQIGASATVSIDIAGSTVVFASRTEVSGRWRLGGDLAEVGWPDDRDVDAVDTMTLAEHWRTSSLSAQASVEIVLRKETWAATIAQETSSAVWVGPRLQGFVAWLTDRPPAGTLGLLLRDGPAVVLVRDWSDRPTSLGPVLTIADLSFRSKLEDAEASWLGGSEAWQRRALTIEVDDCPEALGPALIRAVGWAAVRLLAEETSDGEARPDRNAATRWGLGPISPETEPTLPIVVLLARWVSIEPSATRLVVARSIAGSRVPDPFAVTGTTLIVEAAEIAYRQTVDASVREALSAQLELERSFRSIDAEFTVVRSHLVETLDQTLLRAAAGLVAIAAAAAATDQKSAGFVRFGSILVAAYVMFTGTAQLAMARRDVNERLRSFELVIAGRGAKLASDVLAVLGTWRRQLHVRLRWMRIALVTSALAVAVGGLVVASRIDDNGARSPGTTSTSTTVGPTTVP